MEYTKYEECAYNKLRLQAYFLYKGKIYQKITNMYAKLVDDPNGKEICFSCFSGVTRIVLNNKVFTDSVLPSRVRMKFYNAT